MTNIDETPGEIYRDGSFAELKPCILNFLPEHHPIHILCACLEEVVIADGYSLLQGKVRLRELNEAVDWLNQESVWSNET